MKVAGKRANWERLVITLMLWMTAPTFAQNPPAPLPPQLAFSEVELVERPVETPLVSPLTPREPPPRGAGHVRTASKQVVPASAHSEEKATSGVAQVSATTTGLLNDPILNYLGDESDEGCASCASGRCRVKNTCVEGNWCQRLCGGMYHSVCCSDPCYDGCWLPIADAAFFTTAVRPVCQLRIRWNGGYNVNFPDKAEFLWARADGVGTGPQPAAGALAASRLRYQEARVYLEAAIPKFSLFVEGPYRSQEAVGANVGSGFGDVAAGFKTLLFDCELLQIAAQLRVEMPTGDARNGLGNDLTSIESSLLFGLRITPHTYLQGQVAEWIPVDGDTEYAGSLLHYHASLNQVLFHILPHVPVIGTAEFSGFSFQDGAYTDPVLGPLQPANGDTYLYAGGGLRVFLGTAVDLGMGVRNAVSKTHLEGTLYRAEFRWRF